MKESEFVDLLNRFEQGQCTPREEELLRRWFDAHPDASPFKNETEKERTLALLRSSIYQNVGLSEKQHKPWGAFVLKIAASLLVLAVISYGVFWYYNSNSSDPSLLTASSDTGILKVYLPDGTLVWLKPHSVLQYPRTFAGHERPVTLQGEALFEVEKDPAHPFMITCDDLTTTVLGTSFNIRSAPNDIEIVVLTGRVWLSDDKAHHELMVTHDEKGHYQKAFGAMKKTVSLEEDVRQVTAGTEYNMSFEDARMQAVIQRVEQKFNVTVGVSNPRINNCLITADLTDQSLQKTLAIISTITPIKYELNKNNMVTLRGDGCN